MQSSVGPKDRSEAGGLQWTSQQLGSALGTALIGAVVITGLGAAFISNIQNDPAVPSEVVEAARESLSEEFSFISTDQLKEGLEETGLDAATNDAILDSYSDAQLAALKAGALLAAAIAVFALFGTDGLPSRKLQEDEEDDDDIRDGPDLSASV